MKTPGLALVLVFSAPLFGGVSRAQTAETVFAAHETVSSLETAQSPLKTGDYQSRDRRALLPLLTRLQGELAPLQPTGAAATSDRAAALRKLARAVDDALRQENQFWAGMPNPDAARKLPAATAEAPKKSSAEIIAQFDTLFPRPKAGAAAAGGPRKDAAAERREAEAAAAVARLQARGADASAHPERFFDGAATRGSAGVDAAPASGAGARANPALPVEPVQKLHTNAVPPPNGEEAACRQAAGGPLSKTCGSERWRWAGPFITGLGDAVKGTAKGLVVGLAVTLGALAVAALFGGLPAILKLAQIIKNLANWAAALAAAAIVYQLIAAFKELLSTPKDDPKHWFAMRKLGACVGEAALLAAFVFGIGTKAPDVKGAQAAIKTAETAAGGEASEAKTLRYFMKDGEPETPASAAAEPNPAQPASALTAAASLEKPESLEGASASEVEKLIPKDWVRRPMKTGRGEICEYPGTRGNDIIQISKGNPAAPDALHQNPYVKIVRFGRTWRIRLRKE